MTSFIADSKAIKFTIPLCMIFIASQPDAVVDLEGENESLKSFSISPSPLPPSPPPPHEIFRQILNVFFCKMEYFWQCDSTFLQIYVKTFGKVFYPFRIQFGKVWGRKKKTFRKIIA